jgi:hypothetical protein
MNTQLSTLSQALNLTPMKDYAYGRYQKYLLTISKSSKFLIITINIIDLQHQFESIISQLQGDGTKYPFIQNINHDQASVTFAIADRTEPMLIINMLNQYLELCNQHQVINQGYCSITLVPSDNLKTTYYRGKALQMSDEAINELAAAKPESHYLLASISALALAIIAAIPWAIAYYFGWFVGWLGYLISIGAKFGYELMDNSKTKQKIVIIAIATIIGVLVGNFMVDIYYLVTMINNKELLISYWEIPSVIFYTLANSSEYLQATLSNIGIGLLFGALGMQSTIRSLAQDNKAQQAPLIIKEA